MVSTRVRMVSAAAALFRDHGYQGTGFREVVSAAGTSRGTIYHHFPRGKAQLAEEVVRWVGDSVAGLIDELADQSDPERAVDVFIDRVSELLVNGDLRPGCPVAAVAVGCSDAESDALASADAMFAQWQHRLADYLERIGHGAGEAAQLATLAISAIEGALVLCRASRSDEPLRRVGAQLRLLVVCDR